MGIAPYRPPSHRFATGICQALRPSRCSMTAALQEAVRANSLQAQRMLEWVTEHLDLDSGPQAWDELLIGATKRFPKRRWPCLTVRKLPQLEGSGALEGEM